MTRFACGSFLRIAEASIVCLALVAACQSAQASPASDFNAELERYQQLEQQGRFLDAAHTMERMLQIAERSLSDQPELTGNCLNNLGAIYESLGRYDESEKYYKRALPLYQRLFGAKSQRAIDVQANLSMVYTNMGRYDEAESEILRVIAAQQQLRPANDVHLANFFNTLGVLYHWQGRSAESEALYRRVLAMREKILRPDDPSLAMSLNNLGATLHDQGKFAAAEPLMKRALAINEKNYGPDHPDIASTLNNLANLYQEQGRNEEAEKLHRRTLAIREKSLGPNHPHVATSLYNLANTLDDAEGEPLVKRALSIFEAKYGPNHPEVAMQLNFLANRADDRGEFEQAEKLHTRALKIRESELGFKHPDVIASLNNLALLYEHRKEYNKAMPLFERSLQILEMQNFPFRKLKLLQARARINWELGNHDEAIRDIEKAMSTAVEMRGNSSGSDLDAARHFARFGSAFEQMVSYQLARNNLPAAFRAAELGRGRSLFDQMQLTGTDLLAGVPATEAAALRQRETAARKEIGSLQKQLSVLANDDRVSQEAWKVKKAPLESRLAVARQSLLDIEREIHTISPAYRLTVTTEFSPVELAQLEKWLGERNSLLLEFVSGHNGVFLFALAPDGTRRSFQLQVPAALAGELGIPSGPLKNTMLFDVFDSKAGFLLDLLDEPKRTASARPLLNNLWKLLIPAEIQADLTSDRFQQAIIIPDGLLSTLPFETLIVEPGDNPKYLLDVGPPIAYAPSATVLYNLATRAATPLTNKRKPVLTIGEPVYAAAGVQPTASALDALTARSRYSTVGGKLQPLPFAGTESDWLMQVFGKHGITVGQLKGAQATEAQVRFNLPDRKIIHLACHGLVDDEYGNLFGALALTPVKQSTVNPDDDGFLTLPEIYALDLKACELAILSACDTNYGPEQKGEGVWALSRGFVVAGARRVVASNWLVDDEAAASLISYFAGGIASDEGKNFPVHYASRLQAAKRWVRQQERWSSPYYWGTFVLMGPN